MAVNHVDGTLFISVLFYPLVAAKASMLANAGSSSILFVAASIPLGIAISLGGRKLVYFGVSLVMNRDRDKRSTWFQWLVGGPALIAYLVLPIVIAAAGLRCVWLGVIWSVRHV